jgi:hypothetical protein
VVGSGKLVMPRECMHWVKAKAELAEALVAPERQEELHAGNSMRQPMAVNTRNHLTRRALSWAGPTAVSARRR